MLSMLQAFSSRMWSSALCWRVCSVVCGVVWKVVGNTGERWRWWWWCRSGGWSCGCGCGWRAGMDGQWVWTLLCHPRFNDGFEGRCLCLDAAAAAHAAGHRKETWREEVDAVAGAAVTVAVVATATPTYLEVDGDDVRNGLPDSKATAGEGAIGQGDVETELDEACGIWGWWWHPQSHSSCSSDSLMVMSKVRLGGREDQVVEGVVNWSVVMLK